MIVNAITILNLFDGVPVPPADLIWDTAASNWELTDVNWEG